jgi:hypothetical protein
MGKSRRAASPTPSVGRASPSPPKRGSAWSPPCRSAPAREAPSRPCQDYGLRCQVPARRVRGGEHPGHRRHLGAPSRFIEYPARAGRASCCRSREESHGRRPRRRDLRDLAAGLRGRPPPRARARQQDPARRHLGLGQGAAGQAPRRPDPRVPGRHPGDLRPRGLSPTRPASPGRPAALTHGQQLVDFAPGSATRALQARPRHVRRRIPRRACPGADTIAAE